MKYHKIPSLYKLDPKTHKFINEFRDNEVRDLQNCEWVFKDKLDGTNIRVYWDGHTITYKGRKEESVIPDNMLRRLEENMIEELFEEVFGEKEVIIYGEGIGGKINRGVYDCEEKLVIFDIYIGGFYLLPKHTKEIADRLGVEHTEVSLTGTIMEGVEYVKTHDDIIEGLVGVPKFGYKKRNGKRIIVKIKRSQINDF